MQYSNDYYEELYHHGIRGQKWGVRRYQNADGSLTAAGKKHVKGTDTLKGSAKAVGAGIKKAAIKTGQVTKKVAQKGVDSYKEKRAAKIEEMARSSRNKKPVWKMSNDELQNYINRMNQERNAQRMREELNPKYKATKMLKGVGSTMGDIAKSSVTSAGKQALTNWLNDKFKKKEKAFDWSKDPTKMTKGELAERANAAKNLNAIYVNENNAKKNGAVFTPNNSSTKQTNKTTSSDVNPVVKKKLSDSASMKSGKDSDITKGRKYINDKFGTQSKLFSPNSPEVIKGREELKKRFNL